MGAEPTVSRSVEVPVDPAAAFELYTWRQADWPPGEEMEIEVTFALAAEGTLVTVNVRGWQRLTGGAEIGRGYGEGARELLGWFAEAAAAG
jgi:uncharacterized protein YndB with AHSA1/START domain